MEARSFAVGLIGIVGFLAMTTQASASITGSRSSGFAYDPASGLLTQEIIEPSNGTYSVATAYVYDAYGNKTAATVTGGNIATRTTSTSYDSRGQFQTAAANALGQSESWTYNDRGEPLSHTGPNGLTTTWTYDAFGRKTLETRADGTKVAYTYAWCSGLNGGTATCPTYGAHVTTMTPYAADGVTQNGPLSQTYYDGLGRVIASDTQGFDGSIVRVETQYDAFGHVLKVSRPYFLLSGAPKWTTSTFDALGRPLLMTMPDGSHATYGYHGLTTVITNDKGQTKTTVKNTQGLIASATDAIGKTITYAYDAFGNLLSTTDSAGNVATNTYDLRGNKIASHDPDMGDWTYTYDVLGELKSQTDAKGQVTTISYDLLGRVTQRVEPDLTSTWVYDTAPMGVGKLAVASTDHGYSRSEFYDGMGRPNQTSITILGDTETISTYYDANGRVNMVAYPSGFTVQYDYTNLGYLSDLKDANSTQVYWTANAYDAELHLTQATAGNGIVTNQSYDPNTGFLTGVEAGTSNTVANFAYSYDTLGNLLSRSDATQSLTETFQYDDLNRITQYAITGGATKTVSYDDLGNITSKSDVGTYSYNASGPASIRPHAVAAVTPSGTGTTNTSFTYDANGNMVSGNGRTTTWTAANMVSSITQGTNAVSFDYDSDHARMRQTTNAGTTLYINDPASGTSVEKVTGASGDVQWNEYLVAAGKMIGEHFTDTSGSTTTTATRYFVTDHLGSIAVITDETGAVTERLSYDAWGKRRFPTGADDPTGSITSQTTKGFTGHEMIDLVGLVNMNGRVYDPLIGRFMSADTIIQDPTDSQSLNRYSYVNNNPLAHVDPSGHSFFGSIFAAVIAIVAVIFFQYYLLPVIFEGFTFGGAATAGSIFATAAGTGAAAASASTLIAINAGIAGAVGGYVATGTLKGAVLGAITAEAFYAVGNVVQAGGATGADRAIESAGLHGFVGGVTSELGGGSFKSGFLAAGVSDVLGPDPQTAGVVEGTVESAVVGGLGSVLGGGKFANGAITGAFGYLFNSAAHSVLDRSGYSDDLSDGEVRGPNGEILTRQRIGNIIFNELRSFSGDNLDDAMLTYGHAIINDWRNYGALPQMASSVANPSVAEYNIYMQAQIAASRAIDEAQLGFDPTGGADHFNQRSGGSTANFQSSAVIATQFGPFNNSFPTATLPAQGNYINTYKCGALSCPRLEGH